MMSQKNLLHELLKQDQEPFHLKAYIADRRSQLKKPDPITAIQLKKPRPVIHETSVKPRNLCKHACFFSFQNSPDVRKLPFSDLPSPAMSPCKSPNGAVFLHIPSKTAALLVEAAMRIQKQQYKTQNRSKNFGFGLFGSFLKRIKDRSRNRKRAIGDKAVTKKEGKREGKTEQQTSGISCSRNDRRTSGSDWTESSGVKSVDFEASTTTSCSRSECSDDFASGETRFCSSPFRFSLHRSRSTTSSGRRTPDFCSPAASPRCHEKENYDTRNSDKVRGGGEDEEKEQYSPVSTLEPPFEDEDAEEDYDHDCSYANVQTGAKHQLLYRLRRFEKLAELDPMELERKFLEGSDCEDQEQRENSEDDMPFSPLKKHSVDVFVTEVFNQSTLQNHSKKMSDDMKRLVSDLIVEEKGEMTCSSNNDVVFGRICNRLDSWKEVEFDTIDMMIELDFKKDFDVWKKISDQVEETAEDIEFAIYGLLMEELSEELCYLDGHHQGRNNEEIEC